ncbi:MAG: RusA family crossover junction endodeoxyribonuclease [Gaiellaceae bacterium]
MTAISFTVAGVPAPQGSKTRTRFGMREDNPNVKPWRQAVAADATDAMHGREPVTGPVELAARFYFARPKHHFRSGRHAGELKPTAPVHCTTKPDTDKLLRAIGDALSGIVVRDDAQIVRVTAEKLYGRPRAVIAVAPIQPTADVLPQTQLAATA